MRRIGDGQLFSHERTLEEIPGAAETGQERKYRVAYP